MQSKALRKQQKRLSRIDIIKSIDEEIDRLKSSAIEKNASSSLRKLTEVRKKAKAIEYGEGIVETYLASAVINKEAYGVSEAVIEDYKAALKLAEKFSYRKGIAYAKLGSARAQYVTDGKDSTESIYGASEVLSLARMDKDEYLEWEALKLLSSIYGWLGEISRGYALFEEALAIAEKRGVIEDVVTTIIDGAGSLFAPALYEKHLRRVLEVAAFDELDSYTKSQVLFIYSGVLFNLERYEESDAYIDRVQELLPTLLAVREAALRVSVGSYYLVRGRKNEAQHEFQRALKLGMFPQEALYVNAEMGRMYAKSDPQKALHYFEEGLRFTSKDNGLGGANLLHGYLAEFYSSIGEPEKALQQYALYKTITEENQTREDKQRAEYAEMLLRFDESQKQKKQLEEEVETKSAALTSKAMLLAEQTELMANFRDDLRAILRKVEVNDPAINEIRRKMRELPEAVNWREFDEQFRSVHPQFSKHLEEKYPDLTKMELKLCVLLRLNLKSVDIGKLLSLSTRTIESHRHNIRKKLHLEPERDIAKFLANL